MRGAADAAASNDLGSNVAAAADAAAAMVPPTAHQHHSTRTPPTPDMDEWETLRRNAKRVEGVLEEKVGAYSRLAQRMHSGGPRRVLLRCAVPRFTFY